jgi:hypothetical protein
MTKESYLKKFQLFINEVRDNKSNYSEKDWQEADKKYNDYANILYEKFKKELFMEDELVITKCKASYNLYRYSEKSKDVFSDIFGAAMQVTKNAKDTLKEKVEYYIENDMDDDLHFLIDQSKKAGGKIADAMNEVLGELDYITTNDSNIDK